MGRGYRFYNPSGLKKNVTIINGGFSHTLSNSYDMAGKLVRVQSPFSYNTNYVYDKTRLHKVQTNGSSVPDPTGEAYASYDYYPSGRLKSITYPKLSDGTYLKTVYFYDKINRLLNVTNYKGDQILSKFDYTYDDNSNIESITDSSGTTTYKYDKLNRLEQINRPNGKTVTYSYDARGNRFTADDDSLTTVLDEVYYKYNVWNQLTEVKRGSATTNFKYEPSGLRIKKTTATGTVRYHYNTSGKVIAESNATNNVMANYVWGPDRVLVKTENSGVQYFYLYNGHGDVVQIVDTNGKVVNSYQYDEWGNILNQTETIRNPFKYAGEIYDEETGLYYLRARYYDPSVGRFITKDTYEGELNNPLTLNLYTYVLNNPLIYIDPSGNKAWLIHGTWGKPTTWTDNFIIYIEKLFNEPSEAVKWSGGNTKKDRLQGAEDLADQIYKWHKKNPNEPIRLIGHSHGGNVAVMITNILAEKGMKVETLITIATPVRGYNVKTKVGQHINVYNTIDSIQTMGGPWWLGGAAQREFGRAENVRVNPNPWLDGYQPKEAHSVMHSNVEVWKKYIEPLLK